MPDYLGPHDYPWLRALIDEFGRFAGRRVGELRARLEEPLYPEAPPARKRRAARVLERLCRGRSGPEVKPARVREAVFARAAALPRAGDAAIFDQVGAALGIAAHDVPQALFADLPAERRLGSPPGDLDPVQLALRTNLALVQGLVRRATALRLELCGNARAVIRLAHLRGLIAVVDRASAGGNDAVVALSGPLSLFRRTMVYGHALTTLVPGLMWSERFRLRASCALHDQVVEVEVCSGDPIFPADEPGRFDSKLEARFARDFARLARDWDVIREPEPVRAGDSLIFPDFVLQHRRDAARRWLLEIVGFWTEEYLERKLAHLRDAGIQNMIVCVDAARGCTSADLPANAHLVAFRRWIDAAAVLQIVAPA